jgi:hypothetical protein
MSCCWNQFSRRAARLVWLAPATRRGGRRAQSTLRSLAYARRRTQTPTHRLKLRFWSWRRDLNPRPSDYKSDALPAELRQPAWFDPPRAGLPQAQFYTPAGTIIELSTTAFRVQASGWISNNFGQRRRFRLATFTPIAQNRHVGDPDHSHRQIGWDSAERVRYRTPYCGRFILPQMLLVGPDCGRVVGLYEDTNPLPDS